MSKYLSLIKWLNSWLSYFFVGFTGSLSIFVADIPVEGPDKYEITLHNARVVMEGVDMVSRP